MRLVTGSTGSCVLSRGFGLERLEKLVYMVDHVQLSVGDERYTNWKALELLARTGKSYGVNVLLSENIVENLVEYIEKLITRYNPRQIVLIVPRIYRLRPETFREYVAKIPLVLVHSAKHGVSILFDCIVSQLVFGYEPREEYFLMPNGEHAICSTYPWIKRYSECPDVKYYGEALSGAMTGYGAGAFLLRKHTASKQEESVLGNEDS